MMFEPYVTRKHLKDAFGISERTIVRWLAKGCPCVRIGKDGTGYPRVRLSVVEGWIESQAEGVKR